MSNSRTRPVLLFLLAITIGLLGRTVQAADTTEYELQAGAIYQFCQLVQWPPGVPPTDPFLVDLLGKSDYGDALKLLEKQPVRDRTIHVQPVADAKSALDCQVLLVSTSEGHSMAAILEAIKGHPILTVGESEGFAAHGGCIQLYSDRNRLRFYLNTAAMKRANLTPTPKLLSLATIVTGP